MTIPIAMEFTEYFYSLVKQIPKGRVSTYGALARALGDIRASRAVGRMLNQNPYAPIVPCHRVVMSDGSLGGFGSGIKNKIALLKKEGVYVSEGDVVDFKDVLFADFKSNYPLKKMREQQKKLGRAISLKNGFSSVKTIAGVDVAYNGKGYGALVVHDYDTLDILETKTVKSRIGIPYIPTYLAYREIPVIKKLLSKIKIKPDILLVDGNGVLHPYKMGIATHIGVDLGIPTIGVAKSLLCGEVKEELKGVGTSSNVIYEKKVAGYAFLSSPRSKKPIYISPGHRVSFESTLDVVSKVCTHKIPEPLRMAHIKATEKRNDAH
jgi:deoxyribonuclease V